MADRTKKEFWLAEGGIVRPVTAVYYATDNRKTVEGARIWRVLDSEMRAPHERSPYPTRREGVRLFEDEQQAITVELERWEKHIRGGIVSIDRLRSRQTGHVPGQYIPAIVRHAIVAVRFHHPAVCAVAYCPSMLHGLFLQLDGPIQVSDLVDHSLLERARAKAEPPVVYQLEPYGFDLVASDEPTVEDLVYPCLFSHADGLALIHRGNGR